MLFQSLATSRQEVESISLPRSWPGLCESLRSWEQGKSDMKWPLRLAHKGGCSLCKCLGMPALGAFSHSLRVWLPRSHHVERESGDSRERKRERKTRSGGAPAVRLPAVWVFPKQRPQWRDLWSPRPGRPLYNSTWVRDPNWEQLLSSTQSTPRTVSKIINVKSLGWLAMQQWITWTILICAKPLWSRQVSHT